MIQELFKHFVIGGVLFSTIYYTSNILNNIVISSLISALPIVIICGYIIPSRNLSIEYFKNSIIIVSLTILIMFLILFLLKKFTLFNKDLIISLSLVVWIIIQLIRINILPIK